MESPNKSNPIFRLSRRSLSLWGRFQRNQDGTALTELVIMLPVFILIWVGILNLFKLENGGMRAKITASSQTWNKAMTVARGGHVPHRTEGTPLFAGVDAINNINDLPSENGDTFATLKNLQLAYGGTRGEAQNAATMARIVGQTPGRVPGQRFENRYSRDMLDDSRSNFISSAPGPLFVYFPVILQSMRSMGFNHTPATGNRYGSVYGQHTESVDINGVTRNMSATYDVLNSPVPKPRTLDDLTYVPGFSRLMAAKDPCLKNVLEISRSLGYLNNCF